MRFHGQRLDEEEHRDCDQTGCNEEGLFRAPKSRGNLREYHWFCLEHVRAYNRSWNYCAGMTEDQIEEEIRRSTVWERPTWRPSGPYRHEDYIRATIHDAGGFYGFGEHEFYRPKNSPTPEGKALDVLGFGENVTFTQIKTRYRALVKEHHPDRHGGDPGAEERLKAINQAFNTLKRVHQSEKVA